MKIIITENKLNTSFEKTLNRELKHLKDYKESDDFDEESLPDNISWDTMNWIEYVDKIEVVQVERETNPNPEFSSFNVLINVYTSYLTNFDVESIISDLEDNINETLQYNVSLIENDVINNGTTTEW
jgi:hypothetical protein